ncbi:MAG: HNH endonuclease [Lachnospiraceae bacterium]|nr:HNH endonuclease [Lachnospiraceae bacterium]
MERRIDERTLILPALYLIGEKPGIRTSELIEELTEYFQPEGEDAKILAGRTDTKFSQKVRNLKSHRDSNGMAEWTVYKDGAYTLTEAGRSYLECRGLSEALKNLGHNGFSYDTMQEIVDRVGKSGARKKWIIYDETERITEGALGVKEQKVKSRSRKLREAAFAHYREADGHVRCAVCGFDFQEAYGELGTDYIELHHERPICQYSDEGVEQILERAVENIRPLCANCHRMIHRDRKRHITVEELRRNYRGR